MTPTNVNLQIHRLFYEQCLDDIKVVVHNKSVKHASVALHQYMAKISIDRYNANVRDILTNCGLEPPSQCIEKVSLSSSTMKLLHKYQHTLRDYDHILTTLMHLYDASPENKTNIVLRIRLAELFEIELARFDEFYSSRVLINLGKKAPLYFCTPTNCRCCDLFNYTDKTYLTLGYIMKLFQSHTTGFKFFVEKTDFYERNSRKLMVLPSSIEFTYNDYNYIVRFNCSMFRMDIDKRTASFSISPVTYTKSRPGDKMIQSKMNYIFLCYDSAGLYSERKSCDNDDYVVLTKDFEYSFDGFEEGSKASQQMKALLDEFKASDSYMTFFHYFLTKLPIEKQLLFVATLFTRQSVYRDFY
jgi:hypothetical protein